MNFKNMSERKKEKLATSSKTEKDVLRYLSKDNWKNSRVRRMVAWNPSTPVDVLQTLATDFSYLVRGAVARNPRTSPKLLIMLFEWEKSYTTAADEYVIKALYLNAKFPIGIKRVIETLYGEML